MNRVRQRLYTYEDFRFIDHLWRVVTLPGGYLYANARYPTKLKGTDLPEWYVYGRFYKCFGYLSAKGITDMLYIPNLWVNHFLKDDCLLISYGDIITKNPDQNAFEKYIGWDERVWGGEILNMLKAAEKYSDYDICPFVPQLKEKIRVLKQNHPEEFGNFDFDVDQWMESSYAPVRREIFEDFYK